MSSQPSDVPDDRAALEGELAGLREPQARLGRFNKVWMIVLIVYFVVGLVILRSIDDLEVMRTFANWMIVLMYIIFGLPMVITQWRKVSIDYRIKHIELLLNSAPPRLIQKNNTLLKLRRAAAILSVIYNAALAFNLLAMSFDYFVGVEILIAFAILPMFAFLGVMMLIARLEKQMPSIEATAEWREREKHQSRPKEQ